VRNVISSDGWQWGVWPFAGREVGREFFGKLDFEAGIDSNLALPEKELYNLISGQKRLRKDTGL
jgi:hypothetical protein